MLFSLPTHLCLAYVNELLIGLGKTGVKCLIKQRDSLLQALGSSPSFCLSLSLFSLPTTESLEQASNRNNDPPSIRWIKNDCKIFKITLLQIFVH